MWDCANPTTHAVEFGVRPDSLYVRKLLSHEPSKARGFILSKEARTLRNQRPLLRTRKSGIVGPELDWSVRESDLPMEFIYLMNPGDSEGNFAGRHGRMPFPPFIPSGVRPRTGTRYDRYLYSESSYRHNPYASTWLMSDDQVRQWTIVAHSLGVRFQGDRGYTRPPKSTRLTPEAYANITRYLQISSLPRGVSALRLLKKLRKKVRQFDSFESDQPYITVRNFSLSKREISRRWYDGFTHIRYSVFRERFRSPTLGLVFQNLRFVPITEAMKGILYKIYSGGRVLNPVRRSNFDWSRPVPFKGTVEKVEIPPAPKPSVESAGARPLGDYLSTLRHGYKYRIIKYPDLMTVHDVIGGMRVLLPHENTSTETGDVT